MPGTLSTAACTRFEIEASSLYWAGLRALGGGDARRIFGGIMIGGGGRAATRCQQAQTQGGKQGNVPRGCTHVRFSLCGSQQNAVQGQMASCMPPTSGAAGNSWNPLSLYTCSFSDCL